MPRRQEELLAHLRATFRIEADEHLGTIGAGLLALEQSADRGQHAAIVEQVFRAVHSLKGARHVIDLRNIGLMAGIELDSRPGATAARAFETYLKCFAAGVLVRTTGDIIALSPPLIIERAEIDRIFQTIRNALGQVD